MKKIFTLILLCIIAVPCSLIAQQLQYVNSTLFADPMRSVRLNGNYAFCLTDNAMQIISLEDSTRPALIGGFPFENSPNDLFIRGNYAYVAVGYSGLYIVNIENYRHPILAAIDSNSFRTIKDLCLSGNYAYILSDTSLYICNLIDPIAPIIIGQIGFPGSSRDVCVTGDYALVTRDSTGFRIIDVNDPAGPVQVGEISTPWIPMHIYADSSYAYVLDLYMVAPYIRSGFRIFDIADPSNPQALGSYESNDIISNCFVNGNYVYLPTYTGMSILNISDRSSPVLAANWPNDNLMSDVAISGNEAVFVHSSGLYTVNLNNPIAPALQDSFSCNSNLTDVYVRGNYVYMASMSGLNVAHFDSLMQFTVPGEGSLPYILFGTPRISGDANHVAISGGISGLNIYDVTNPFAPVLARHVSSLSRNDCVGMLGNYVYMADGPTNGVRVLNINDSGFEHRIFPPSNTWGLCANHDLLYITQAGHFSVANIADNEYPYIVSNSGLSSVGFDISISGPYAYIAQSTAGVSVWDISDPEYPVLMGTCDTPGDAKGVAASGDHAFIADGLFGVEVLDATDPYNPVISATYNTPGRASEIFAVGDDVFVADYYSLMLLKYTRPDGVTDDPVRPNNFFLSQNYPNPFNSSTTIQFDLPADTKSTLSILDITGRQVRHFDITGDQRQIIWDGAGQSGLPVASGIYFYAIENQYRNAKKMVLLR